jgi:hypothetical protein
MDEYKNLKETIIVSVGANGAVEIQIRKDAWKDPALWGSLLADTAKAIAKSYGAKKGKTLNLIKTEFMKELKH